MLAVSWGSSLAQPAPGPTVCDHTVDVGLSRSLSNKRTERHSAFMTAFGPHGHQWYGSASVQCRHVWDLSHPL